MILPFCSNFEPKIFLKISNSFLVADFEFLESKCLLMISENVILFPDMTSPRWHIKSPSTIGTALVEYKENLQKRILKLQIISAHVCSIIAVGLIFSHC